MKNTMMMSAMLAAFWTLAAPAALAHEGAHKTAATAISTEEQLFGRQGDPANVTREIRVEMSDTMRFTPSDVAVKQGETVRFVVHNKGKVMHEMVLGTMAQLQEHGAMMRQHPGMEHDAPYMAHVKPGATQDIVWQFTRAGDFNFACLVAGHLESGMKGALKVGGKAAPDAAAAPRSEGEVRKVDKAAGKITLRHGELKNLGMPPMTMVFRAAEPAMLERVKPGDKVSFVAQKVEGIFTVTEIDAAQ
ncbi:copper-binding protein [Janthinobacterium fluminis]|uniref:Copper-binding protein n=1 Tax=Janthinobacterium fluminis TaxID=2987524 RepID=A0ABT5JZP0_9BURK|nr:copper-binding protein [Janthinobacterium fluminis]MDC8758184.1 copper-binding protein [Janthinobacterium fluminis]